MTQDSLYVGDVWHRRFRPVEHTLRYRMFWLHLDLDRLGDLKLRLLKAEAPGVLSFRSADHLDGSAEPLRLQVERSLRAAGVEPDGGPVRLMCMPRMFGYVFNPLSVYFCHRRDESLAAVLYEVNNTFGERHRYIVPVARDARFPIAQEAPKRFHVSPFLDMALDYDFRVEPPGETVSVAVNARDRQGPMIATSFRGKRVGLTDAALARALIAFPAMTLKVTAAIHYEALKLWIKGVKIRSKPPAPADELTVGASVHPTAMSSETSAGSHAPARASRREAPDP